MIGYVWVLFVWKLSDKFMVNSDFCDVLDFWKIDCRIMNLKVKSVF